MRELFKPTAVQKKALKLLSSSAKHVLLFGGSRSGKTTVLVMAIIFRACRYPGSRHLICRFRAKDARSSVLQERERSNRLSSIMKTSFRLSDVNGFIKLFMILAESSVVKRCQLVFVLLSKR